MHIVRIRAISEEMIAGAMYTNSAVLVTLYVSVAYCNQLYGLQYGRVGFQLERHAYRLVSAISIFKIHVTRI